MQIWEYELLNAYHYYTIVKSKHSKLGTVCREVQWSLNFQKEVQKQDWRLRFLLSLVLLWLLSASWL